MLMVTLEARFILLCQSPPALWQLFPIVLFVNLLHLQCVDLTPFFEFFENIARTLGHFVSPGKIFYDFLLRCFYMAVRGIDSVLFYPNFRLKKCCLLQFFV